MPFYRCFVIGRDDKVESAMVLDADTDNAAQIEAEKILELRRCFAVEVWYGGRRVYRALSRH
jgi:hypothetical protein